MDGRYDQLKLDAAAVREELHTEIERMLTDIINFKVRIQASLEKYEDFVAQEVELECVEQEARDVGSSGGRDERRGEEMEVEE